MEWTIIEIGVGIAASNLATLRPFYRWVFNIPPSGSRITTHEASHFKHQSVRLQDVESEGENAFHAAAAKKMSVTGYEDHGMDYAATQRS